MTPARDLSRAFTLVVLVSWLVAVALPLLVSLAVGDPLAGLPLAGILLWFAIVRFGRLLSPASRADSLMRRGRPSQALALCDRALAVKGSGAWLGPRRLAWLNRRTTALLALDQPDAAAENALQAIELSADPETLGNLALALLRLNRYDEAAAAGRIALSLTRERSVLAHATLAHVALAQGRSAEAEALAGAGAQDARALQPLVRQEHYALCLAAMCRAIRTLKPGSLPPPSRSLDQLRAELRHAGRKGRTLRAMSQAEEAEALSVTTDGHDRALSLLESALHAAPGYVLWLIVQPGTLTALAGDERISTLIRLAEERMERLRAGGPPEATVTATLARAEAVGLARPTRQSSSMALFTQIATLSSTFVLLLLWTIRFFIAS